MNRRSTLTPLFSAKEFSLRWLRKQDDEGKSRTSAAIESSNLRAKRQSDREIYRRRDLRRSTRYVVGSAGHLHEERS